YTVSEGALAALEQRIARAASLDEARRAAADGLHALRCRSAGELVGPLAESCAEHAALRGKQVRFELEGADAPWPPALVRVFDVPPQLVRNSIDHGIEEPSERAGKPGMATIRLTVRAEGDARTLTLRDDGRGIAIEPLARRARDLGLITQA